MSCDNPKCKTKNPKKFMTSELVFLDKEEKESVSIKPTLCVKCTDTLIGILKLRFSVVKETLCS